MRKILVLLTTVLSSCAFDASNLVCENNGETRKGAICENGVWVKASDVGSDPTTDPNSPDVGVDDVADAQCTPRTNTELCELNAFQCGSPMVTECGTEIELDCGMCQGDGACGVVEPFVCGCDVAGICDRLEADCGMIVAPDGCPGDMLDCATCTDGDAVCSPDNTCECPTGFSYVEGACKNIDECSDSTLNDCDVNVGVCTDSEGGFSCACDSGYSPSDNGTVCTDMDECVLGTDDCIDEVDGGSCDNVPGDFECSCGDGYNDENGDGTSCPDIDECLDPLLNDCDANAKCDNEPGDFTCSCDEGYVGDGKNCVLLPTLVAFTTNSSAGSNTVPTNFITSPMNAGVAGDFYIAVVASNTTTWEVNQVSGMNLSWTPLSEECNSEDRRRLEVWVAYAGANVADGTVTAGLTGDTFGNIITIVQVANANPVQPIGNTAFRRIGNGNCNAAQNGASNNYDVMMTVSEPSLVMSFVTSNSITHEPGNGWFEFEDRGLSTNDQGVRLSMNRITARPTNQRLNGIFAGNTSWALFAMEILPR